MGEWLLSWMAPDRPCAQDTLSVITKMRVPVCLGWGGSGTGDTGIRGKEVIRRFRMGLQAPEEKIMKVGPVCGWL